MNIQMLKEFLTNDEYKIMIPTTDIINRSKNNEIEKFFWAYLEGNKKNLESTKEKFHTDLTKIIDKYKEYTNLTNNDNYVILNYCKEIIEQDFAPLFGRFTELIKNSCDKHDKIIFILNS